VRENSIRSIARKINRTRIILPPILSCLIVGEGKSPTGPAELPRRVHHFGIQIPSAARMTPYRVTRNFRGKSSTARRRPAKNNDIAVSTFLTGARESHQP